MEVADALPEPFGEEMADSSAVGVRSILKLLLQGLQQRTNRITSEWILLNGFIYGSESRLLVVVVDTPVAVEDEDSMLLSSGTVAAVDAVVGTVIPLAREHKQPFWIVMKYDV